MRIGRVSRLAVWDGLHLAPDVGIDLRRPPRLRRLRTTWFARPLVFAQAAFPLIRVADLTALGLLRVRTFKLAGVLARWMLRQGRARDQPQERERRDERCTCDRRRPSRADWQRLRLCRAFLRRHVDWHVRRRNARRVAWHFRRNRIGFGCVLHHALATRPVPLPFLKLLQAEPVRRRISPQSIRMVTCKALDEVRWSAHDSRVVAQAITSKPPQIQCGDWQLPLTRGRREAKAVRAVTLA
jgi:hypothetical protein